MIRIEDTKNMIGITIHGDYQDLNALHSALSDYLRFYFDHQETEGAYSCYETILGLCYDIRHAYQGDRNIESIDNNYENISQMACIMYDIDEEDKKTIKKERNKYKNGNLYFNVEVLYPWAVFYLFALQAVAEDVYQHEWFENDEFGYTEYQAESDLALIQYFVHLLWGKLQAHLPEEVTQILWDYTRIYNHVEYYFGISDLYMSWLCTYWVKAFSNKTERHDALPLICLELCSILDEDEDDLEYTIAQVNESNKNASGKTEDIDTVDDSDEDYEPADKQAEFERKIMNLEASIAQTTLQGLKLYDQYFLPYNEKNHGTLLAYQNQDDFDALLYSYVRKHGMFTEESYDQWLEQEMGEVEWEMMEW